MKEVWRPVIGYEDSYEVSNLGSVRGTDRERGHRKGKQIIKGKAMDIHLNRKGYSVVHLSRVGEKPKMKTVHRLVAEAFIPNEENKEIVNHINGIKTDCRAENLEWVTDSENAIHAYGLGLRKPTKGELNGRAKLSNEQVVNIFKEYKEKQTPTRQLAKRYGVGKTAILGIVNGKSWAHLTAEL